MPGTYEGFAAETSQAELQSFFGEIAPCTSEVAQQMRPRPEVTAVIGQREDALSLGRLVLLVFRPRRRGAGAKQKHADGH